MSKPNDEDRERALAMLRDAFPHSEGWVVIAISEAGVTEAFVRRGLLRLKANMLNGDGAFVECARAVIAERDQLVAAVRAAERERIAELMAKAWKSGAVAGSEWRGGKGAVPPPFDEAAINTIVARILSGGASE